MEQSSIKKEINSHYLYTEPNYTFDENGVAQLIQTPLEDLCVYVDLAVEVNDKNFLHVTNGQGDVYTMSFSFNKSETTNGHIHFHSGSKAKYGLKKYLTTDAYDVTYKDIKNGEDISELFGINSIDISYNSFMVPEVVINFTDIRGGALMGPATERYYGQSDESTQNKVRSFFQSFFSVPYPRFKMLVKGFYGKPVTYELTCSDFKASFDSQTGNFNAVARMVGYSFALLDDVTMSSLIAAPLSTYRGRDYWTEQVNKGRFTLDGNEMITLDTLVKNWTASKEKLQTERQSDGYKNEVNLLQKNKQESENQLSLLRKFSSYFYNGVKSKIGSDSGRFKFFIDSANNSFCIISIGCQSISLTEELYDKLASILVKTVDKKGNTIFKNFEDYVLTNTSYDCLLEVSSAKPKPQENKINKLITTEKKWWGGDIEVISSSIVLYLQKYKAYILKNELENGLYTQKYVKDISNSIENIANKDDMFIYFFNGSNIMSIIRKEDKKRSDELQKKTNSINVKLTQDLVNTMGFKPTVKNVMKILFAHLETLIYCIYEVKNGINSIKNNRTLSALGLSEDVIDNVYFSHDDDTKVIYPFPSIFVKTQQNDYHSQEKGWIGEVIPYEYAIEQHLVEGILDGISNTSQGMVFTETNNIEDYKQRTITNVPYPICPSDLFVDRNPFRKSNYTSLIKDYYNVIGTRIASVLGGTPCLFGKEDDGYLFSYDKAGERDAENFYIENSNIPLELLMKITTGSFVKDLTTHLELEMFNSKYVSRNKTYGDKVMFEKNFYYVTLRQHNISYVPLYAINTSEEYNNNIYDLNHVIEINPKQEHFIKIIDSGNILTKLKDFNIDFDNGWASPNFDKKYINGTSAILVPKWDYEILNEINNNAEDYYYILKKTNEKINEEYDVEVNKDYLLVHNIKSKKSDKVITRYEFSEEDSILFCGVVFRKTEERDLTEISGVKINGTYEFPIYGKRLSKDMISNYYTLFSIPGYYENGDINYQITLFSQYGYISESNIDIKALLFLSSFNGKYTNNKNKNVFSFALDDIVNYRKKEGCFKVMPFYMILSVGALLKCKREEFVLSDYVQSCPLVKHFLSDERLDSIRLSYQKLLIKCFDDFVTYFYKSWDEMLSIHGEGGYDNEMIYNIGSNSNIHLREHYYRIIKTNYEDGYLMLFRDDSQVVKEMTEFFFELKLLVKGDNFITNISHPIKYAYLPKSSHMTQSKYVQTLLQNQFVVAKESVQEYLVGFNKKLQELYNKQIVSKIDNGLSGNENIQNDIKINTYYYFKLLWDKWLCNSYNDVKSWSLETFFNEKNGRIHFIDSFYNDIGDRVGVNIEKFVNLILRCKYTPSMNYPLISFISSFLKDNNLLLFNIQNFLETTNKGNIDNLFKAIPFKQIKGENIDEHSDIIILYQFEPSSTLNMEKWQGVKNDNFNIYDIDSLQPLAITSKKDTASKIPAFGVTYGMGYQSYFHDIKVGMESPAVTEQSIQAMLQISDNYMAGSDSNGRKVVPVAQDMYTIYANNAYQCTVSMMGCAWIQPLMYFQLLNVPLFNGAYIVHKVTHHIEPNNMVTNFVGTRLSKFSTKMVDSFMFDTGILLNREKAEGKMVTEELIATIENNCSYQIFNVKDNTINSLIEALNKTVQNTASINGNNIVKEDVGDGAILRVKSTNAIDDAILFDIIVTTYRKYCSKIVWITNNDSPQTLPSYIYIEMGDVNKQRIFAAKDVNNGKPKPFKGWESLHSKFLSTFKKVFGVVNNTNFTSVWSNFNVNEENLLSNVNKKLSNINILKCDDEIYHYNNIEETSINEDVFQWVGENGKLLTPNPSDSYFLTQAKVKKMAAYAREVVEQNNKTYAVQMSDEAKKGAKTKSTGRCAEYVRKAMFRAGILSETPFVPISACAYDKFLEAWGFEKVFDGMRGETKAQNYSPQNGDISVISGLVNGPRGKKDIHGHIQIYNEDTRLWYSDYGDKDMDCYSTPRPFKIYRIPDKLNN